MKTAYARVAQWASTPSRRAVLVVGVLAAAAAILAASLTFRSAVDKGRDPPRWTWLVVIASSAAMAVERLLAFRRAFSRPCRRKVEFSREWLSGAVVVSSLVAFGMWGIFDADAANQWTSALMLIAGIVAIALLAVWARKPICDDDED